MLNKIIVFMSPTCGACVQQKEIMNSYFKGKVPTNISMVNVDRFPDKLNFIEYTPTWAFPQGNETYALKPGVISDLSNVIKRKNNFRFGAEKKLLPNINNLAVYGKNFPDNKGFDIPNSFYGNVEKVWGTGVNTLDAGVGGSRSLGPGNVGEMYSNGYFNNIRMAHPADQLGTALYLNRNCNTDRKTSTVKEAPGMIFNSPNPQIVDNTTGFGRKRRSRFGGLYSQMGPAFEIGNQYLISKDTGKQLFSGARQNELPRPYSVNNKAEYIGNAPIYNPLKFGKKKLSKKSVPSKKSVLSGKKAVNIKISIKRKSKVGSKKKKCCIGEGSVLSLSKGKIKVKN
jgi:hypothetical protein